MLYCLCRLMSFWVLQDDFFTRVNERLLSQFLCRLDKCLRRSYAMRPWLLCDSVSAHECFFNSKVTNLLPALMHSLVVTA